MRGDVAWLSGSFLGILQSYESVVDFLIREFMEIHIQLDLHA